MTNVESRPSPPADDYVHTDPGTPAGDFLRRFWQPVYHAVDLMPGRPVPLRIMNDFFTLYRGESGRTFLIEARCPHRRTQLSTGWIEGDALRCAYHGWKFTGDGRCVEQPAEESRFCDKISIKAWPTREYLGLIFAYLGPGNPPELPRFPEFERFDGLVEVDSYVRRCNYFQNVENALDMSHVGFTHGNNRVAFDGIGLGRRLKAEPSPWGVTYTFTREDGEVRVQQFGMPNIFYMTALPNDPEIGWQESLFWWVPIDDRTHMQFSLHRIPVTGETAERIRARRQARRQEIDIPHQTACELVLRGRKRIDDFDPRRVDLVRLQDDVVQVGQGVFADRRTENTGRSDIGVAAIRRLWRQELAKLRGQSPLTVWTRPPSLRPRTWGIPGNLAELGPSGDGGATERLPGIVDVRPFVEVDAQMEALHGAPPREE